MNAARFIKSFIAIVPGVLLGVAIYNGLIPDNNGVALFGVTRAWSLAVNAGGRLGLHERRLNK